MNIGIVGQGAMGSLFTYYWRQYRPSLLLKQLPQSAKTLVDLHGKSFLLDNPQYLISKPAKIDFDAIIITVKGYQLPSVIVSLSQWLLPNTKLILVQNGMGGADLLAKHFRQNLLFVGTTTDAVYAIDPLHYKITAKGALDIGIFHNLATHNENENVENDMAWVSTFFNQHPQCHLHEDINFALYRKLAINAVINPLTAVMNIKNGELVHYCVEVNRLKSEVFAIYDAMLITYSSESLSSTIDNVIANTANNYSSMHQDLYFSRQTEIDTILGYLLQQGTLRGLSSPFMQGLFDQISAIDNGHKKS